jgi:diketogulonate reductase-like aldo/keto reductase
MEYRNLAGTGVRLPAIGLGTWQYNGGVAPVQAGMALGACFVDTAEAYGSEEVVGQAIRGIRKEVFLATKVSPRHFRRSDLLSSADASLKRLGTDYIDLYQLHWPNYTVPIDETLGAMEQLVDDGKVRFIGVSNFAVHDLRAAQKVMTRHRVVSNQVRYNLIDRTIEHGVLRYCQEQDITVIAHSPLASSLPSIQAGDSENILNQLAQARSRTVAQIALNWCLAKQGVVTIPKSNSVSHVKQNCAASDFQLAAEELRQLDTKIKFRARGPFEIVLRRLLRRVLQTVGKNQ